MDKLLIITLILAILVMSSVAFAEFATTKVFFNIPQVTSFAIAMPDTYAGAQNFSITATTLASANSTDFVSFNATAPASWVQPSAAGSFTRNQSGNATPIFQIMNLGNVNITINMTLNDSGTFALQGLNVSVNATTTGGNLACGNKLPGGAVGANETARNLTNSSFTTLIFNLTPTATAACKVNVTMWGFINSGVTPGEYAGNLITNSSKT